ncbi:hypothetical protein ADINL_0169 [Nitrincola lacisaponensis]|uniref:Uncharacterized protein n=1 Tax=Nitrincola lacisaponensis TaxID=267850 RepID=A0A063Y4M6_9GAMM|nr:hypothetical protein ADINL_0169 [Nitrincola lacisaponensis]
MLLGLTGIISYTEIQSTESYKDEYLIRISTLGREYLFWKTE